MRPRCVAASSALWTCAVLLSTPCAPLSAQEGQGRLRPSRAEMVRMLEEERAIGLNAVRAFLRRDPPRVEVDSLVADLEELAGRPEPVVRSYAVMALLYWARSEKVRGTPQVLRTLERVYFGFPDAGSRGIILMEVPEVVEAGAALLFLRRVATSEEESKFCGGCLTIDAIESLARMGEPGRAVLRELHEKDLVPGWWPRKRLEDLASRGYRLEGPG